MNAIGTAVCGGMLSATFIDLLFIPLFFVLVSRIAKGEKRAPAPEQYTDSAGPQEVR